MTVCSWDAYFDDARDPADVLDYFLDELERMVEDALARAEEG